MRLIDADATIEYLREFRCKDCDRRKGMKRGKIRFCYEVGEAPCRACDIEDTIDYFLDEAISPTVDAVPIIRCKDCKYMYFAENRIPSEQENVCGRNGIVVAPDWFCADGERQEGR